MSGIVAIAQAITALMPTIISLINLYKEAKQKGWINEGIKLEHDIKSAKTNAERIMLAQRLFDHDPK